MKYLALAVLLAVMQTPPPVPGKAANHPAKAANKVKQKSSNDKTPTPPPVSVNSEMQADTTQRDSSKHSDENTGHSIAIRELPAVTVKASKRDWADWGYWGFNLLLVLVGAVQVWLLCQTLRAVRQQRNAMLGQLGTMRRQVSEMAEQTGILKESVAAANKNAEAADKNASTLVNIERAWLVAEVRPPKELAQPAGIWGQIKGFGFEWAIKNCGRSPGFITRIGARFHIVRAFSDPALTPEPNIDVPGMPLSEIYPIGIPLGPGETLQRYRMAEEGQYPSPADLKLINDGAITYLAYGVIEYKTVIDDTIHKTWFCHRWLQNQIVDTFPPSPIPANYTKYT